MTLHKLQPDDFSNRETVSQITMFLASIAFLYGASLVQGGPPIWVGDAYNTANMLPGAPESWGFILLVSSTAMIVGMIVGRRWLFLIGLIVTMLWNLFFALSFLREAIHVRTDDIPGAPLGFGAFITYFGISGVFLLLINTYRGKNALSKNQKKVP